MGTNELESSPEVNSHYLKSANNNADGRPSAEPKTASRQPSGTFEGEMRPSSQQHSSAQMRQTPIDQSSIIKNGDESAFNNNLHIFPSGAAPAQAMQAPQG